MPFKSTKRGASVQPGYYLPSYIEQGDPMEDDEKLKSSTKSVVGYKSYGRVPVALYEGSSNLTGDLITEPTTPLTASYDSQRRWWNDVPNEQVLMPGRLRLTASDLKPPKSDYDTYIQNRDQQDQAAKCQTQVSTSLVDSGRNSVLASGLSVAGALEYKDIISTEYRPSSANPSRQVFGGLPVMMPSRNWNVYPSSRAPATSSRSNLEKSAGQRSQLDSIPEAQQSPDRSKAGSVHGSPLFKRRHAELPGITTDEFLSHHTLKRTASEVLRRRVVPQSPFLSRVVGPVILLTSRQLGSNQMEHSSLQGCFEGPSPLTSENLRLFLNHAVAEDPDKSAILTMPSGFPCADLPVFFLSGAPALGTGRDGKPISGTPVTTLDLYPSSEDGCVLNLHLAISDEPAYSRANVSASGQGLQGATLDSSGGQYPDAALGKSLPSSHIDIGGTEPFPSAKGRSEELRSMYSMELRSTMSQQIRSGSTGNNHALTSNPGPLMKARPPVQLPADTQVSPSYGKPTRSNSNLRIVGRPHAQINQSNQPNQPGRFLNPDAEPYLEDSQPPTQYISAATETIGQVRQNSSHNWRLVTQALPPSIGPKQLSGYGAKDQFIVDADPSVYSPAEEEFVRAHQVVRSSNMTFSPSNTLAPVWVQHEHPRSWKSRLAMGENIPAISTDAFGLLAVLDPTTYSLPYGVSCRTTGRRLCLLTLLILYLSQRYLESSQTMQLTCVLQSKTASGVLLAWVTTRCSVLGT